MFAKEAEKLEQQAEKQDYIDCGALEKEDHICNIVSSIISSVAYLEGFINEIFASLEHEATERYAESYIKSITFEQRSRLIELWEDVGRKLSTLEKYEFLLKYLKGEKFDKGIKGYQNIDLLIKLRNYFIHYQPERIYYSVDKDKEIIAKIGQKLKGKYLLNPKVPDSAPFFPYKCLSSGCAIWGVNSVLNFTEDFAKKIVWEAFGSYTRDMITEIISTDII